MREWSLKEDRKRLTGQTKEKKSRGKSKPAGFVENN